MKTSILKADYQYSYWTFGLYYFILLIVALSWTNFNLVEPPTILRIAFTMAFVLPLLIYHQFAPAIITIFVTMRLFTFAPYGFLPSEPSLYLYFSVILFLKYLWAGGSEFSTNIWLKAILLFAIISNLINFVTESDQSTEFNFLRLLLISILLSKLLINTNYVKMLELAFVIVTFCLSIYTLVFYKEIVITTITAMEPQKVYRSDPNYLGCILSIGMVIAFYYLVNQRNLLLIIRIFYISTFVLGVLTLGQLASRGAFAAASLPVVYILYKKTKSFIAMLFVLGFLILLFVAVSTLNSFNPLIERFSEDSLSTGSDRTIIWIKSFGKFINSDFQTLLFGGGALFSNKICGEALGGGGIVSPHNNYLEILYDYGFMGLMLFFTLFVSWLKFNFKNVLAMALIILLAISCMTLSPLMYLPFWLLIILIDKQELKLACKT
jgi:hypothetical protein